MAARSELLLAFYGDDFTGSTDAMEALALSGLRTVLFLSPPTLDFLARQFPDLRCIGVSSVWFCRSGANPAARSCTMGNSANPGPVHPNPAVCGYDSGNRWFRRTFAGSESPGHSLPP